MADSRPRPRCSVPLGDRSSVVVTVTTMHTLGGPEEGLRGHVSPLWPQEGWKWPSVTIPTVTMAAQGGTGPLLFQKHS